MAEPSPLLILIEHAEHQRDQRGRVLSAALSSESSAAARLKLLSDYRRDYLASYREATQRGVSTSALVNYQEFLAKLDRAIEQQEAACALTRAESTAARTELIHSEKRRHSFQVLNERRLAQLQHLERRRERQTDDEIGARISQRTRRGDD